MGLFSKKSTLLAVDIGTASVKMLVLEGTSKKLKTTFENVSHFRISKNADPEEEKKIIKEAVIECAAALNKKKFNKVIFSVPAQNVIARIITIGTVPLDKLDSIIGYEAEQHIPFPLNEVAFKYQLISYDDENMDVLLTAIKQDRLDELFDIITGAGFETDFIDVTCFSVFNLLCYQQGLIKEKLKSYVPIKRTAGKTSESTGDLIAMLDIGSGTADITVGKNDVFYFTRSALIAGDNFTEAIQKKYNISWEQAEKIKREIFEIDLESALEKAPTAAVPKSAGLSIFGKPKPFGKPGASAESEPAESKPGIGIPKPTPAQEVSNKPTIGISKPAPIAAAPVKPSLTIPLKPGAVAETQAQPQTQPAGAGLPKPPAGIGIPKPLVGAGIPKPAVPQSETVAPTTVEQQPASESQSEPAQQTQPVAGVSKPAGIGIPKPSTGIGIPKPPAGIGIPKPSAALGIPKPLAGAGIPKPGAGIIPKPAVPQSDTAAQTTVEQQPASESKAEPAQQTQPVVEASKPAGLGIPKPPTGIGIPKPPAGIGIPKPPAALGVPKPGTETSSPEDQNKNPKLLKGMFAKPEIKPVPKPSLLKPGMPAKKLMGFGGEEQKDESKLKLNLPKPPGAPPQSLGAAAAGDVSISEEPGIDISSIDKKELFNTVRPLLDRLVIELRRSFDYFKTQLSGGQITKIILTGGSAKLNGLDVYLSKRLELPVEIFNPIERIETQNLNEKSHEYSVALGLGLRNIYDIFPININLIPDDITLRRRKVKQKKYLIIFFVLLILALGELGLFVYLGFQRKTNEANYLQTEYDKKYATILKEVNEVKAKKEGFEKVRGIIQNIQNEKAKWLDILRELSELLNDKFSDGLNTKNIWIETITFSEKSRISITGVAKSYDMIKNFIMRLGETKHFTPSQEPPSQQETIINEKKYYRFSLFADLKHNVVSEEAKPEGGAKEDGTENSEEVKSKENPQEEEPKTEAKPENKASEEDDDEGDE